MNPRGIAWYILKQVFNEHKLITENYPFIFENIEDERDRRLVVEIVYGVCRFRGRLDYVLSKFANQKRTEPDIWLLLVSAAYQILFLTRTPDYAIINDTVSLVKQASYGNKKKSGFVNAVLKRLAAGKDALTFPTPENLRDFIESNLSFPYWLGMKWVSDYGKDRAVQIMKSLNFRKPVVFRCFHGLDSFGPESRFHPTPYIDNSFEANVPIYLMRAGSCYVMNESSQLVAELLRTFSGKWVLDAASSPGGKGFILRTFTGIENVIFNDVSEKRILRILENSHELAIPISAPVQSDFLRPVFRPSSLDAILLDAPCTGTGTISGHPELKWLRQPGEIRGRAKLQNRMIRNAFSLLKPGGILVYSTCSLEKEEGEDVVLNFVSEEEKAQLVYPFTFSSERIESRFKRFMSSGNFLRISPDKYLDGFFAALIQKKS
ncbi:MAG: hypothetical protein DRJ08_01065 [Acidobacteria bacterium]|nr:MAG: hypothetical protein DRJ14_02005 [Acidobacteriota bacterium]RLE24345.1 MAG: hypothetical protein DRJ08_01065 [Acidobacteriota bacterium]